MPTVKCNVYSVTTYMDTKCMEEQKPGKSGVLFKFLLYCKKKKNKKQPVLQLKGKQA